jgi:tagatose-1,6-bisphosphate aldolase non-catalytic subunit AgaZ/GatZ
MRGGAPGENPARLAVGPMSKNTVEAVVAVAYRRNKPMMLIPSRRQVEAESQGSGYVEGWNTRTFAQYVRSRDPEGLLMLCRDHGGPYQNTAEIRDRYTVAEAMSSALESLREDVVAGFHLLHIDTSAGGADEPEIGTAIDRAVDLYGRVADFAESVGRRPLFEVGFEAQGVETNDPDEFAEQVGEMVRRLRTEGLPLPTFVVAQTGTKVVETSNIGRLRATPEQVSANIRKLADVVARYGMSLKAHNCDYLSHADLMQLIRGGVVAINIAPELGVAETRAFLQILNELGLTYETDRFLQLAYDSLAWRKWLAPDSAASTTERAVMAGHYVYNSAEFQEIKKSAQEAAYPADIDGSLRRRLENVIESYAHALTPLAVA